MRTYKGFQKGQTLCFSNKGLISLLQPSRFTMEQYEIYCLDFDGFQDVERYYKEEEALKRCKELLD